MPDYIHKNCYLTLIAVAVFDGIAFAATNAWIDPAEFLPTIGLVTLLIGCVVVTKKTRFTDRRIEKFCTRATYVFQGFAFLLAGWTALRLANHLSMKLTADIAYVDDLLARMDEMLFLSWPAYVEALQAFPLFLAVLDKSYTSLSLLSVVAFAAVCCCRDIRRSAFFLETFFYTAVICTFFGMFFPAQGTVQLYLGADYDFSNFPAAPGMWFIEPLAALRSGDPIQLTLADLPGLVTFPSFHTGACIVLIASFWRTMLFLPSVIYGGLVIAATPIYGGHYLVDLLAGALVAAAVAAVLARQPRFAGLFEGKKAAQTAQPAALQA